MTSNSYLGTCATPPQEALSSDNYISQEDLLRELTALAKAEHRRHRLACAHTSITVDQLISEGWLAAQRVAANYDPELGTFLHYLRRYVKRELGKVVRVAKAGPVSVSHETVRKAQNGTLDPVSSAMLTSIQHRSGIAVGNAPGADEGEPEQGMVYETDINMTTDEGSAEDIVIQREQAELIHILVDELEERNLLNARVVRLRFGMEDGIAYSVEETAAIMGTGTKNVERRYTAAMKTLRQLTEPSSLSAG
jgi:RNA polymerase sigma factor (sigma-70 family)